MTQSFVALEDSPLFRLQSRKRLALLLGTTESAINRLLRDEPQYKERDIAKPDGGLRRIEDPARQLKQVQSRLAHLLGNVVPPDYLFCPVKGRSPFDNAVRHYGQRVVITIDIRSFFPSVKESRVVWFFTKFMGCSPDVAYLLTKLVTYRGHLPTGSPTSPIIGHFAYRDLWDELNRKATLLGIKMSMWIDDITFSGAAVPETFLWEVKQALARNKLRYHKERRSISQPARITGVILRPDSSIALPHKHHRKVHVLEGGVREADSRADRRMSHKLQTRLEGMRGQEIQLVRAAARTASLPRNVARTSVAVATSKGK